MRLLFYMFAIVTTVTVSAQPMDSMKQALQIANADTSKLKWLVELSEAYRWAVPDSTVYYALQGLPLARHLQREREQIRLYSSLGEAWAGKGNFAVALHLKLRALKLAEKSKDPVIISWSFANLGAVYFMRGTIQMQYVTFSVLEVTLWFTKSLKNYFQALSVKLIIT
jgi:tetratricopeptide (TPR) repeat protein